MQQFLRPLHLFAAGLLGLALAPGAAQAQVPADVTDFVTIPKSTGIVTIKDTTYAIPTTGNVRYFSPTGDNTTGDGLTPATAWRTLTNALLSTTAPVKIPTGATLIFADGSYPTGVPAALVPVPPATTVNQDKVGIRRALTLQPAPGAKVWFTGSLPVTNWVADGAMWRADNWTYKFRNNSASAIKDPAFPASHLQDMVFVDDLGLKQVLTRAEVRGATATSAATFYVDYANNQIFMGTDPTGHKVEASAYFQALELLGGSSGTKIRGIGFRNYGGDYALAGFEFGYTIENCTFAWNALIGLRIGNTPNNVRLRGNNFTDNGHQGVYVGGNDVSATNFVIDNNTFRFNNNENFRRNQSAAGMKFLYIDDAIVRNNLFEYNNSMGLWFDLAVERVKVFNNVAHGNSAVGIFFEVSRGALIAGNVAYGNSDGIYISGSSDAQIYNNTMVGNLNNLRIKDTSRQNDEPNMTTRAAQVARGIDYNTYEVDVWNNVIADGRSFNASILNEWSTCRPTPMVRNLDNNLYLRSSNLTPAVPTLITWNQTGLGCQANLNYTDLDRAGTAPLENFTDQTGFETTRGQLDGRSLNELFVDWMRGDFRLKIPACQLPDAKQNIPATVRTALGLSATETVQLGAGYRFAAATGPAFVVNDAPTAALTGNGAVCGGGGIPLSIALTGTAPWTVTYTDGTTPVTVTGILASPYTFSVTPSSSVTYSLTSVSDCGNAPGTVSGTVPVSGATWNGSVSTDWFTAANWNSGVPTATTDAIIGACAARFPVLGTGSAVVRNLVLGTGASLTLGGGMLEVKGDFMNNGSLTATGGTLQLSGPIGQNMGGSLTRLFNLSVGASGASLSGPVAVQRLLTLNGNLTTNGQPLTLLSDATGTAMVVNNGGAVLGATTMQRYITPTNAGAGYRHYSSPVQNAVVGDLATAGFTPVVNPAFNTQGNSVSPFPTVLGYDESRLSGASAATQSFGQGWVSPAALSSALTPGRGVTVNLPGTATVALTGTLNNGAVALAGGLGRSPQAEGGWHLLGNPYPSPIDWDQVVPTLPAGVLNAVYVFRSTSQYAGSYASYVNGTGTLPDGEIAAMQSFFVRTAQAVPAFSFTNAARVTTYTNPGFFRGTAERRPLVQLDLVNAAGSRDAAIVYFENGATTGFDGHFDAYKIATGGRPYLAVAAGTSAPLSISGLPTLGTGAVTVPLQVEVPTTGAYTLTAARLVNLPAGYRAYLRDLAGGTLVDLAQQPTYSFSLAAGFRGPRFELVVLSSALATASAALAEQVGLYPNPARQTAWVVLPAALRQQPVTAVLCDALGRTVRQLELSTSAAGQALPLAGLPAGVYSLRLATSAGAVVKRLVVE